jgi:hypothetical protein
MADFHVPMTPPEQSDPRGWSTAWIATVGIVLTFVIIVLLQVLYHRTEAREYERKIIAAEPVELIELRQQQAGQLSGYGWVDREQGIASIPIEEAMKQVVDEESGGDL